MSKAARPRNPAPRVSRCLRCGDPVSARGTRGPIPSACSDCQDRRRARNYIRAARRIAERHGATGLALVLADAEGLLA